MTTINNSELIEKVGGIEKAREIIAGAHWENISYSNGSYYSHSYGKNDVCLDDLRTAIAEHDREFKVGDLVIKTHPKNTILWPVLGVYKNGGVWLDYKGFCWKPPQVRHATPEEIKAGHRLEAERHG